MSSQPTYGPKSSAAEICATFSDQIAGRTIIVTGPSPGGVGYATAEAIAKQKPGCLILATRNLQKLEQVKSSILEKVPGINIKLLQIDLTSLESVKSAAKEVLSWNEPIDVLINNAAVMDTPFSLTKDGHEIQWQTNYLSPFLFTYHIMPLILKSKNKRIVNLSSVGHNYSNVRWDDPDWKDGYKHQHSSPAYGASKTAMTLWSRALAERYGKDGLTAYSVDPGAIPTPLQDTWPLEWRLEMAKLYQGAFNEDGSHNLDWPYWKTLDQGASTSCRAAFDPTLTNGTYLVDAQPAEDQCKDYAKSKDAIEKIVPWTEQLIGSQLLSKA